LMNGIELDALGCGAFRTPVGTKGIPGVWDIELVTSTCMRLKNGDREWFANRASCASLTSFCVIRCYGLLRSATITKFGVPQLLVQNRMWSCYATITPASLACVSSLSRYFVRGVDPKP